MPWITFFAMRCRTKMFLAHQDESFSLTTHSSINYKIPGLKYHSLYNPYIVESALVSVSETDITSDLEQIKTENDRIIMKIFGLEFDEYFPQGH